jgi:hypothetical protein
LRLAAAFAAHEWRTQMRSLRFRVLAALYAVAGTAPAAVIWLRRAQLERAVGGATFAAETLEVLPLLIAVLSFLISLDAVTREQEEGAWTTVSLAGMSSAGYLLRRWLALQSVLLPLSAIPLLLAALSAATAAAAGGPGMELTAGPFLGPWLIRIAPLVAIFSALALGVGTVAGGTLNAFLLGGFALLLLPELASSLLFRFGIRADHPLNCLDLPHLVRSFRRLTGSGGPEGGWTHSFPVAVSETPYDLRFDGDLHLSTLAVPAALAAAFLGLAVRYLRRTRPDVRPWRIPPEHPLRTFLGTLARLRERYTPDPAPARADLLALGLALLMTAGSSAWLVERARHYDTVGRARFFAEKSEGPAPTPPDVVPGRWRIEGAIGPGRRVTVTVAGEMRNQGSTPRGHLAFALNPELRIDEASAGEGRLALARSWDRLAVELTPPIPPGGRRELRFRLSGEPAQTQLGPDPSFGYQGFFWRFGAHLHARFPRELIVLAASYRLPAVSPRRIELAATDLSPVPRYQAWKHDEENRVMEEIFHPPADLDLSLTGPPDVFLADACGTLAKAGRLAGRCRLPLSEIAVLGGRYRVLPDRGNGTAVAVYPGHAALAELHLGFIGRGASELEEAWPGLGGLRRTVALEWPGEAAFSDDPVGAAWGNVWRGYYETPLEMRGNLILIDEGNVIRDNALLKPETFVASLVASRLSHRRPFAVDDSLFFHKLFQNLAMQRLGLGPQLGATVGGLRPGTAGAIRVPLPKEYTSSLYWNNRFPALVAGLRHQMGEEAMRQAVEEVLARRDGHAATRKEMFAAFERHGGPDLHRFLQENLVEGGLAEPVLDGVEFLPAGDGWRVTGQVVNRGDAQAVCKVVLTTELGPVETVARAGAGQAAAFELRSSRRPQAVLLDPDQECHRLISSGAPNLRVSFQGTR